MATCVLCDRPIRATERQTRVPMGACAICWEAITKAAEAWMQANRDRPKES